LHIALAPVDRHRFGFNSRWRKKKAPPAISGDTLVPLLDAFLPEKTE